MASLIHPDYVSYAIPPLTTPPTTIPSVPTPPSGVVATTFTYIPSLPPGFIRPTIVSVSWLSPGTIPTHVPSIPPPLGVEPNFHDPVTLAVPIIAVSAITSVLAISFLFLRLYSIFKITRTASWDDGAIVLALAFSLTYAGLLISVRDYARHGWDQPISVFTTSFFRIIAAEIMVGALAFLFSKLSALLLLLRLFSQIRTLRYLIYFGILWASITSIMALVAGGTLCAPRHDESGVSLILVRRCRRDITWGVAQGALNMALNFYILALPIPILWRLEMGPKKKIGAIAVFLTGFIVCVISATGLAYRAKTLRGPDLPWNTGIANILAIAEINLTIVLACMPACAAYARYFPTTNTTNTTTNTTAAKPEAEAPVPVELPPKYEMMFSGQRHELN